MNMKISFGAKILTKPEQFYLPTDNLEDRNHIQKNFKELEEIFEIPQVKTFTQNDTLTLSRQKTKNKFHYSVNYKPENSDEKEIKFRLSDVKDFSAYDIFRQITFWLAYINGKLPENLFLCGDYKYILENLYLNTDK